MTALVLSVGDVIVGPFFGTRYEVVDVVRGDVWIRTPAKLIEWWTVRGLEKCGYTKEASQ